MTELDGAPEGWCRVEVAVSCWPAFNLLMPPDFVGVVTDALSASVARSAPVPRSGPPVLAGTYPIPPVTVPSTTVPQVATAAGSSPAPAPHTVAAFDGAISSPDPGGRWRVSLTLAGLALALAPQTITSVMEALSIFPPRWVDGVTGATGWLGYADLPVLGFVPSGQLLLFACAATTLTLLLRHHKWWRYAASFFVALLLLWAVLAVILWEGTPSLIAVAVVLAATGLLVAAQVQRPRRAVGAAASTSTAQCITVAMPFEHVTARAIPALVARGCIVTATDQRQVMGHVAEKGTVNWLIAGLLWLLCILPMMVYVVQASQQRTKPFHIEVSPDGPGARVTVTGSGAGLRLASEAVLLLPGATLLAEPAPA